MICQMCKQFKPIENKDLGICASCNHSLRDARALYPTAREEVLRMCIKNDVHCPIMNVPIDMNSEIHHTKGRMGFADEWAYQNDIPLLIDARFFLPVSSAGHKWIEDGKNREEAERKGYILSRHDIYQISKGDQQNVNDTADQSV